MTWPRRAWSAFCDLFTAVPADSCAGGRPAVRPVAALQEDGAYSSRLSVELSRHPVRLVAACLASVLGPAVMAHAGSPGPDPPASTRPAEEPSLDGTAPGPPAPGDPTTWRAAAEVAARTCPGLPATVLVAIGRVESSLGAQSWVSTAGAMGPMQFLPATWAAYGADGDGDGRADVMNTVDALHGAARLLCANGGADAGRLPSALWNYNHSEAYVARVLTLAVSAPN